MFNRQNYKKNLQSSQEIVRDFKGYVKNIVYKSNEYQNIMMRKALYSIRGFRSHPIYFDIMVKEGEFHYIGDSRGIIGLNIFKKNVKM